MGEYMFKKILNLFKVVVFLNLLFYLINGEWTATFICLFNLISFFISDFIQSKLHYSDRFNFLIYLFLISSLLGGEVYYLYVKFKYFDTVLHVYSSFIISGIFVYLFRLFKVIINKYLFLLCIFSFAMMVAALWEITEFSIDRLFLADMQKDTVITEINSSLLSSDGKNVVNKKINSMMIGDTLFDGYVDIGLYDTIFDMISAVFGSIIYILYYKIKEAF